MRAETGRFRMSAALSGLSGCRPLDGSERTASSGASARADSVSEIGASRRNNLQWCRPRRRRGWHHDLTDVEPPPRVSRTISHHHFSLTSGPKPDDDPRQSLTSRPLTVWVDHVIPPLPSIYIKCSTGEGRNSTANRRPINKAEQIFSFKLVH